MSLHGVWGAHALHNPPPTSKTTENKLQCQLWTVCSQPNTPEASPRSWLGEHHPGTNICEQKPPSLEGLHFSSLVVLAPNCLCFKYCPFLLSEASRAWQHRAHQPRCPPGRCAHRNPVGGSDWQSNVLWSNRTISPRQSVCRGKCLWVGRRLKFAFSPAIYMSIPCISLPGLRPVRW